MLSLVYKDFLLQRGTKSFIYMLIMPVISAFAVSSEALYVILPCLAGSYLYIIYANALDDKYSAEKIFNAMPIGRNRIVGAKYLGILLYMLAYLMIIAVLSTAFKRFLPGHSEFQLLSWHLLVQLITVSTLYYGIFFPLYFRLGYQKSRWANYISMLASAGLFAAATKGLSAIAGTELTSLQASLEYLTGINTLSWNIFLPFFSVSIIIFSLYLSVSFYKRREF